MILYHLDRYGSLLPKKSVDFLPEEAIPVHYRKSEFLKFFDYKISSQGWNQLSDRVPYMENCISHNGKPAILVDSFISQKNVIDAKIMELVFELVRRAHFPEHPSRLTSLFALKEVSDFQLWPKLLNKDLYPNSNILKIDAPDDTPKYDVNLLRGGIIFGNDDNHYYMGCLPLASFDFAFQYWSGIGTETPRWEYLISLPIAGDRITEANCPF